MEQQEIEKLWVGSFIADPLKLAISEVNQSDLKTPQAVYFYAAAREIFSRRDPVNIQTLAMNANVKFLGWLSEAHDTGLASNFERFSREIKENAKRERLSKKLSETLSHLKSFPTETTMESIRKIYSDEIDQGVESGTIHEAIQEFDAQVEKYKKSGNIGIETGFYKWDQELITYEPGHLWGLGGFTSVGKTATALEFIGRIGHNNGLAIFSMEMTKPQIISRMISRITGHSSRAILSGKVDGRDVFRAKEYLSKQSINIFRKSRDWFKIANVCRALKMQGRLDIAVFDYMQNIGAEGKTTHDKMEYIARSAQDLVQDLEITGIMLSQISLQQNREDSGSPEFKGGGGLAEVCDIALHLQRPKSSQTELVVEMRKNRHGPRINLLLEYQDHFTRLEEARK